MDDSASSDRFEVFSGERRARGAAAAARTMADPGRADHPATSDRGYTDGEAEMIRAVADYRARTGRKFPTVSEQYRIFLSLGYVRPEG